MSTSRWSLDAVFIFTPSSSGVSPATFTSCLPTLLADGEDALPARAVVDEDRHVAEGVVPYLSDGQRALRAHLDELGFEPHRILRQPLDVHVEGHVAPEQQTFAQSQIVYLFRKMAPAHLYERSGAAAGIYLELPSELGFEGAPAVHERRQILLRGQHAARA